MSIPLIAVSPQADWIVTAAAKRLTIFDSTDVDKTAKEIQLEHNILVICVSADGKWLFVASDDKVAAVYSTSTWLEVKRSSAPKKVSAACFTHDCRHAIVGDKFGDVYSLIVDPDTAQSELTPFLGHYCAIITSMASTPLGVLASGDRDGKLRISELPADPAKGSWSIMSYCLGHTAAVTCCALCKVGKDGSDDQHVLVSGGLEGLVIVWNWVTGEQRCSMRLSQGEAENDLEGEGGVVGMATEGSLIAVAQAAKQTVVILQCKLEGETAQLTRVADVVIDAVALPSRLCFAGPDELWAVGASGGAQGQTYIGVGRAHTSSGGCAGWTHKVDDNLSKKICEHSVGLEAAEFSQYHAELHKKDYSWQEREDRKNKGRKRPAEDANVPAEDANDTENVDAGVGDGSDGEEK